MYLRPRQRYRREGLVDLEQVQVADLHAGLLQHPGGGLRRAVEVEPRFGADECLGDDPCARPQSE